MKENLATNAECETDGQFDEDLASIEEEPEAEDVETDPINSCKLPVSDVKVTRKSQRKRIVERLDKEMHELTSCLIKK